MSEGAALVTTPATVDADASPGRHFMVVIAETEHSDADFALECSGVTDLCEAWQECGQCSPSTVEIEDGEYLHHGIWHQMIEGCGMTRTGRCVLRALEVAGEPIDSLHDADGHQALTTGRHSVVIDECEEGTAYIAFSRREAADGDQ